MMIMRKYKNKKEFMKTLPILEPVEIYKEVLSGRYITRFPLGYWKRPDAKINAIMIGRWLIEHYLKWDDDDIRINLSTYTFRGDIRLRGMLDNVFNASPIEFINAVYPNTFRPWELASVTNNYWNKETARDATRWLIEERLGWTLEEMKMKLTKNIFLENGLCGMMLKIFNNSTSRAIQNAYPEEYNRSEFKYGHMHVCFEEVV